MTIDLLLLFFASVMTFCRGMGVIDPNSDSTKLGAFFLIMLVFSPLYILVISQVLTYVWGLGFAAWLGKITLTQAMALILATEIIVPYSLGPTRKF